MATRPRTVRNVRAYTIGSRTPLLEAIRWPRWLYFATRWTVSAVRHWKVTAPVVLFAVLWGSAGLLATGLLTVVVVAAVLTGWLAWRGRGAEGAARSVGDTVLEVRRRNTLTRQWPLACKAADLLNPETRQAPRLEHVRGDGTGSLRATVECGREGIPTAKMAKAVETLSAVVTCKELVVAGTPSTAQLHFHWKDPMERVLPLSQMPLAPRGELAYGYRRDGSAATVKMALSLLTGGLTGHGKSNIIRALLADCIRQGLWVDLYVSDPKDGLELLAFEEEMKSPTPGNRIRVRRYETTPEGTEAMVVAAEKAMRARRHQMRLDGVQALDLPSEKYPLVVVLLDELVVLDKMLRAGSSSPAAKIGFTGRTALYVLWANTQAAQLDVLGRLRTFIPQRICVATDAPQTTDSILGGYAESKGALCSSLTLPGQGFSAGQGTRKPEMFRSAEVPDKVFSGVAKGRLPASVREAYEDAAAAVLAEETAPAGRGLRGRASRAGRSRGDQRTALYRWYYVGDEEYGDSLGYVGISVDVLRREAEHTAGMRAFLESEEVRRTTEWFDTRAEAMAAEETAIRLEGPIWNDKHNGDNPRRRRDKVGA